MALGGTVQNAVARYKLNEAEQLLEQGEHAQAIPMAVEAVQWAVERVDAAEPIIIRKRGTSKVDALLQRISLRQLSYTSGFPPMIKILVAADGTENIMVRTRVDKETTLRFLTRSAQIIAGIERHVGSLDAPYGKQI